MVIPGPKEQVIPAAHNLCKALLLMALLAASFWLADRLSHWLPVALLAIPNVMLLTGMGVLAHDAVHRVLFRTPFWNEFWGGLLSGLALIPFQANRNVHLSHHSHAHQPGLDPEEAMHRYPFLVAAAVGAPVGMFINYRQVVANARNGRLWRVAQDVVFVGGAMTLYFVALPGLGISLMATVVPVFMAFPFVFAFRALSDHYGLPAVKHGAAEGAKDNVTGWVVLTPRWLEWLWSHVNYHEVHHKYPWLAHTYLPQVFAATRDKHPYAVGDGYWRSLLTLRKRTYYMLG
jgi:fatty acid desaturase